MLEWLNLEPEAVIDLVDAEYRIFLENDKPRHKLVRSIQYAIWRLIGLDRAYDIFDNDYKVAVSKIAILERRIQELERGS